MSDVRQARPLTPKQARFVAEFIATGEATAAARRAGYSPRTAQQQGYQLLQHPSVAQAVAERQQALQQQLEITQERVLREYARIAFADMRRFASVGPGGITLKDSEDWTDDDAAAVAEIAESTSKDGGSVRFKLHNKQPALDSLSRHLGLFRDSEGGQHLHQHLHLDGLSMDEIRALAARPLPDEA